MRAAVIRKPGDADALAVENMPLPIPVNSEYLVRVTAAGINPIDVKTRAGGGVSNAIAEYPAILGYDFCGVVEAAPFEFADFKPGDEVYGMTTFPRGQGSFAEVVAVSSLNLTRKPARLDPVQAAGVPLAALTAWGLVVDMAKAHTGQRMLIHAASGGVGHFAVQLAHYFGAQVFATGSEQNRDFVLGLGASRFIDYRSERFEEVARDMDVVIDLIGNVHDDTGTRSLDALRTGGLIVNAPSGSWPNLVEDAAARGMRATHFKLAASGATLAIITRLLDEGSLRVHVDRTFPLERIADAHRAVEEGHTRGKVVVTMAESAG